MSLINTTLKNLDQQKQTGQRGSPEDNILAGLSAPLTEKKHRRRFWSILILIILLLVLAAVFYFVFIKPSPNHEVMHKINTAKPIQPIKKTSTMAKVNIPLSPQQKLAEQYQNALTLIVNNHVQAAFGKLHDILREHPDDVEARITLAALLLKSGRTEQANGVLVSGLARDPDNIKLIEFQVNMLASQKKIGQALTILQQHTPDITQSPDYYALMALLYQRQGEFILAAQLYDQLVKVSPANAVWWVGLGVALESAGKNNAAREAYAYALQRGANLDLNTRTYVEHQIDNLK